MLILDKTENFIRRAKVLHGDKYDYSETQYLNSYVKLKIKCSCGYTFHQLPHAHLQGKGCYWCGHRERAKKLSITAEEFINRANIIHKGKYDYTKTSLNKSREKVTITCPDHGDFQTRIDQHLGGNNCPGCGVESRVKIVTKTYETFVKQAQGVHGSVYDYSKVEYINNRTKVCIICPLHGDFYQSPDQHINNKNKCPICAEEIRGKESRLTTEEFISKAKDIHGDTYDYSKSVYITSNEKITIECRQHGDFHQTAGSHLAGCGCPNCGHSRRTELCKKTTEEFISEATKVHNNKYDYSQTEYVNNETKVCIICPKHGPFYQKAVSHTTGAGCWSCKSSKGERLLIDIFIRNGIKYIHQFSPPIYNRLRYDFYLPDFDVLIEFQGGQHFFPIEYFGGEEGFIQTRNNDAFKKSLALQYRLPLIYFTYKHLKRISKELFERSVLRTIERRTKFHTKRSSIMTY